MSFTKFKLQRLSPSISRHYSREPTTHPEFRNQHITNDHFSSLCNQGHFDQALQFFDLLQSHKPNLQFFPSTYARLFRACSSLKSIQQARKVHLHLLKSNTKPDVILENHILTMYGKCGSSSEARKVFDEMPKKNLVSWSSMISGYSSNGGDREAVELYIEMGRLGLRPDGFLLWSVLGASAGMGDVGLGRQLHCQAVKLGLIRELIVQNALVEMYAKLGMSDAYDVFVWIPKKDIVSWCLMIGGLSQMGRELEALFLFREMLCLGVGSLNEFVFGSVFKACSGLLRLDYGKQVHGLCIRHEMGGDEFAGCSLSDMYAKCGRLDLARKAFYEIENPDLVSWNSIICGFSSVGDVYEVLLLLSQMRHSGLEPDDVTILCILCSFTAHAFLSQGEQIHSYILKVGFDLYVSVCNSLITMYSKCLDISAAYCVFNEMKGGQDLVSWNAMLTASVGHNQVEEVFQLLKLMHHLDTKPDHITINSVVEACSRTTSAGVGKQVCASYLKLGLDFDNVAARSLVDACGQCGYHEESTCFNLHQLAMEACQ